GEELPPLPEIRGRAWSSRWTGLQRLSDLERARAICVLAAEAHPPSARDGEVLLRRIAAVEKHVATTRALAESTRLMRAQRWSEALDALAAAGEADLHVLNQRGALLLRLDRFEEADAIAERIAATASPVAEELRARYPALATQHRLRCANRLIRAGDLDAARKVLEGCAATDDQSLLDVTYALSFCRAMKAYRLHESGSDGAAVDEL